MALPQTTLPFDFKSYLEWEERQPEKHEFFRGEVFAMVGARRSHVAVTRNILVLLWSSLRGSSCQAYAADMKVRAEGADAVFYPDVVVTCDPRDHRADQYIEHPVLVVEVLSDSTAAYDRGDKFAAYRSLPSLKEYLLVDIASRRLECFRRDPTGHWVLYEWRPGETAELASVELKLAVDEVFENVDPPTEEATAG